MHTHIHTHSHTPVFGKAYSLSPSGREVLCARLTGYPTYPHLPMVRGVSGPTLSDAGWGRWARGSGASRKVRARRGPV